VDALTPFVFAAHPYVVRVGGKNHVRAIQKLNQDESLTFFGAIEEGIVLTIAKSVDLIENLESAFERIQQRIGRPHLVLGFDSVLRYLEATQLGVTDRVGDIMRANNVIGFATYGEQINATHVNQTFTAVAIGNRVYR
jgi:hypothetical protein